MKDIPQKVELFVAAEYFKIALMIHTLNFVKMMLANSVILYLTLGNVDHRRVILLALHQIFEGRNYARHLHLRRSLVLCLLHSALEEHILLLGGCLGLVYIHWLRVLVDVVALRSCKHCPVQDSQKRIDCLTSFGSPRHKLSPTPYCSRQIAGSDSGILCCSSSYYCLAVASKVGPSEEDHLPSSFQLAHTGMSCCAGWPDCFHQRMRSYFHF